MTAAAIAILERLVAFDTISARSNLELIDWVADYLDGHGIASVLTRNPEGKANLFATIGPAERGGVILSGHTDVVPVAGQEWHSDPFRLETRPAIRARPPLWPRQRRHEGVYRAGPGPGAAGAGRSRSRSRCISPSPMTRRSAASARRP